MLVLHPPLYDRHKVNKMELTEGSDTDESEAQRAAPHAAPEQVLSAQGKAEVNPGNSMVFATPSDGFFCDYCNSFAGSYETVAAHEVECRGDGDYETVAAHEEDCRGGGSDEAVPGHNEEDCSSGDSSDETVIAHQECPSEPQEQIRGSYALQVFECEFCGLEFGELHAAEAHERGCTQRVGPAAAVETGAGEGSNGQGSNERVYDKFDNRLVVRRLKARCGASATCRHIYLLNLSMSALGRSICSYSLCLTRPLLSCAKLLSALFSKSFSLLSLSVLMHTCCPSSRSVQLNASMSTHSFSARLCFQVRR